MRGLALVALLLSWSSPAWAQDAQPAQPPASDIQIDATKLGVSLERIQRGLRVSEVREKARRAGALHLAFEVQVYGVAPKIEVLKGIDLMTGEVPGSAPSHQQFRDFVTPVIYRTPGLPLSAGLFWLAGQIVEKSKKTRCEEEIAAYRALLMQGVSVAAPRCTQ
jgi:hypothetical protein